ncbi:DUF1328 domain-containing protein [Flavobacterium daemonense]|uniref:DUF1328 domain-containing protein n=1 Tax=Flavobacterium daemonense TaxID=1393049 RepID=UPI001184B2B0|nr:DUF1328 domain-containing protein [Flavobacterium daemonense]KAF2329868.1 DUF1328 domain-containing protein [Flavobacterium daemonense]
MSHWTVSFIILTIIAGVYGFGGAADIAHSFVKLLFFVFIILTIITAIIGRISVESQQKNAKPI